MGAVMMVPFARMERWPVELTELKQMGFTLIGMTPDPAASRIESIALPDRVAILLGSEAEGLSSSVMPLLDFKVVIAQRAGLDSLNVGHAAAIAFHRLVRVP